MARPRRDDQDVLLDRIAATLGNRTQLQPWTLAEVAPDAGLSPAGLIKRFGSRGEILRALSRRWIDSIPEGPLGHESPEQELRAWVARRLGEDGPQGVAQGLVNLIDDLVDDDLRALLGEGWAKEIRYLSSLLQDMHLARLRHPDRGAALLFDALNGAMLRRVTQRHPRPPTQLLDDLTEAWR